MFELRMISYELTSGCRLFQDMPIEEALAVAQQEILRGTAGP